MLRGSRLVLVAGWGGAPTSPRSRSTRPCRRPGSCAEGTPLRGEPRPRWPGGGRRSAAARRLPSSRCPSSCTGSGGSGSWRSGSAEDTSSTRSNGSTWWPVTEQAARWPCAVAGSRSRLAEARRLAEDRRRAAGLPGRGERPARTGVPQPRRHPGDRCRAWRCRASPTARAVPAGGGTRSINRSGRSGHRLTAEEWELFQPGRPALQPVDRDGGGDPHRRAKVYVREVARCDIAGDARPETWSSWSESGSVGCSSSPCAPGGGTSGRWPSSTDGRPADGRRHRGLGRGAGARASVALDNAEMLHREAHIARQLVGSLLPSRLPEIRGSTSRFGSAGGRAARGGRRLLRRDAGRPRHLSGRVGDVQGKGMEAAAMTGLARTTTKIAAHFEPSPAGDPRHLNSTLVELHRPAGPERGAPLGRRPPVHRGGRADGAAATALAGQRGQRPATPRRSCAGPTGRSNRSARPRSCSGSTGRLPTPSRASGSSPETPWCSSPTA